MDLNLRKEVILHTDKVVTRRFEQIEQVDFTLSDLAQMFPNLKVVNENYTPSHFELSFGVPLLWMTYTRFDKVPETKESLFSKLCVNYLNSDGKIQHDISYSGIDPRNICFATVKYNQYIKSLENDINISFENYCKTYSETKFFFRESTRRTMYEHLKARSKVKLLEIQRLAENEWEKVSAEQQISMKNTEAEFEKYCAKMLSDGWEQISEDVA